SLFVAETELYSFAKCAQSCLNMCMNMFCAKSGLATKLIHGFLCFLSGIGDLLEKGYFSPDFGASVWKIDSELRVEMKISDIYLFQSLFVAETELYSFGSHFLQNGVNGIPYVGVYFLCFLSGIGDIFSEQILLGREKGYFSPDFGASVWKIDSELRVEMKISGHKHVNGAKNCRKIQK
ncbi:hypothetical protein ACJX0J_017312, partial [Zea mays]